MNFLADTLWTPDGEKEVRTDLVAYYRDWAKTLLESNGQPLYSGLVFSRLSEETLGVFQYASGEFMGLVVLFDRELPTLIGHLRNLVPYEDPETEELVEEITDFLQAQQETTDARD